MFFKWYIASPGVPKNSVGWLDVWPQGVINHLDLWWKDCMNAMTVTLGNVLNPSHLLLHTWGFGCNFWVIVFVWGAGGLLSLLNFPYHIETPIMWCKKLCLLVCSEDLAWLARVINHWRQKQLLLVTCVLVVRKTRMTGKAVGSDFEECPAREFFLKDPSVWSSVSTCLG